MDGAFVIVAVWIRVLVAVKVREEASFICECVLQGARTERNFSGEVFEIPIVHRPSVALFYCPIFSILALPLR